MLQTSVKAWYNKSRCVFFTLFALCTSSTMSFFLLHSFFFASWMSNISHFITRNVATSCDVSYSRVLCFYQYLVTNELRNFFLLKSFSKCILSVKNCEKLWKVTKFWAWWPTSILGIETGISDYHHLIYSMFKSSFKKVPPQIIEYTLMGETFES